jgi:hypothetical protein
MATFTVDLLTGNIYLFSGDFSGSGSTPTSGSTYPQVQLYSNLPVAGSAAGMIYVVRQGTSGSTLNRRSSGFYFSTGAAWRFLGDTPEYFKSNTFQVYDSVDNTKGLSFVTSGVTSGAFRKLKVQNSDGTIAYLTDLNTKVNTSVFNMYTGTTAPATYVSNITFSGYTGTTLLLIQGKQDTLIAGTGISIAGNVISVTGSTTGTTGTTLNKRIQVVWTGTTATTNGNVVIPLDIIWDIISVSSDAYLWSGGSSVWIKSAGTYELQYHITLKNDTANETHSIGAHVIKNSVALPITAGAGMVVGIDASGEISLPPVVLTLANNDRLDLSVYRIGTGGNANLVSGSVYLLLNKLT